MLTDTCILASWTSLKMKLVLYLNIYILILLRGTLSHTLDDVMALHQRLLNASTYDQTLRPGKNQSEPTIVTMRMKVGDLVDIDEIAGTMKITGDLKISWMDERIAWDPDDYNGIRQVFIQKQKLWVPEMYCISSLAQNTGLGLDNFMVKFSSNGLAIWDVQSIFWSTCNIQITHYPVDAQSCLFKFFPNGYSSDEIRINIIDSEVIGDNYKENSAWELKNGEAFAIEGRGPAADAFIVSLSYERRSIIHIITVIVPTSLMGFVHMLVFFLPDDSGERVGFSVTVLLSLAVYQSMLSEALPKASVPQIPIISIKVFADLLISFIIQMCVIFSQYLYIKEQRGEDLPDIIKGFARCIQCLKRKQKVKADEMYSDDEEREGEEKKRKRCGDDVDIHRFRRIFNIVCGWIFFASLLATNISLISMLLEKTTKT